MLILNADFWFFGGTIGDFNTTWFSLNGSIILGGKLIDAVYPLLEFIFWISL